MRRDAREHRQQLVLAARRVFAREGYRAPLEAVVSESGLGRGTLYRHFPDRRALLVALMEHELEGLIAFFEANRDSDTLFEDMLLRQGEIGVAAAQALQDVDDARMPELFAPLTARADILYAEIIAALERKAVVQAGLTPTRFRMLLQMIISAGRHADSEDARTNAMRDAISILRDGVGGQERRRTIDERQAPDR